MNYPHLTDGVLGGRRGKMKRAFLLWLSLVLIVSMTGCNFRNPVREAHITVLTSSLATSFCSGIWTAEIEGTTLNDGDYDLRYAEVVGEIYTEEWRLLDKSGDWITPLKRNEEWCFRITCHSSYEPHHYKVWVRRLEKL